MEESARIVMSKTKSYINKELLISLVHERPELWNNKLKIYKDKQLKITAWREICAILKKDFMLMRDLESGAYVKSIIKLWSQTRDSWVRSLHEKIGQNTRPYLYHDKLLFLKEVVSIGENQDNIPETKTDSEEVTEIKEEIDIVEGELEINSEEEEDKLLERRYSLSCDEESQDTSRKRRRTSEGEDVLNTRSGEEEIDATNKRIAEIDLRINAYMDRMPSVKKNEENRHLLFFRSLLPSLSELNDDHTLEFQSGVIGLLQDIRRKRHMSGW